MTIIKEITPSELAQRVIQQDKLFLLDVREPNEVAICAIDGATHIPMSLIPLYLGEIPDEIDIIIYCHHGVRSLNVAYFLAENGFDVDRLYNLSGGIDSWSLHVEPTMRRY